MKFYIPATAFALALVAGAPVANAQTVITPGPLVTVPAETIQTTETVRTIRPARLHGARRQVVTTRTITRRVIAAHTIVARTVPATPQPLYDEVVPAPIAANPQPLYDEVAAPAISAPGPFVASTPVVENGAVFASEPYTYRYVYQPDRILVIDPATGIAVQSIAR
ncbi:MAG: hypothetical protein WCA56_03895 [Xanthobacteraceae bacterium]|jgi:hypothetical protein